MCTISRVPSSAARASVSPSCARRIVAERVRIGTVRREVMPSNTIRSSAESTTATSRLARTISACMLESVWRDITRRTLPIISGVSPALAANGDSLSAFPENTGAAKVQSLLSCAISAGCVGAANARARASRSDSLA